MDNGFIADGPHFSIFLLSMCAGIEPRQRHALRPLMLDPNGKVPASAHTSTAGVSDLKGKGKDD